MNSGGDDGNSGGGNAMMVVEMEMTTVLVVMVAATKPRLDIVSQSLFQASVTDSHTTLFFPHLCWEN